MIYLTNFSSSLPMQALTTFSFFLTLPNSSFSCSYFSLKCRLGL